MYKNNLWNILFPILLAAAVVGGLFAGAFLVSSQRHGLQQRVAPFSPHDNKISYLLSLIDRSYVDPVDLDSVTEAIMPMIVGELDPHSVYISAGDFAKANETLDGEFDGIGVLFNMATDTAVILNVIPGGPSDKAGIVNGDRIMKVNDTIVAGVKLDHNELVKKLRGPRGTKVELSLKRGGVQKLIPVTVERGKIPIKSLTAAFMIAPRTAYINLESFSKNSHDEVARALASLQQQGMEKLIFDLRGNSGGFLDQAIELANDLLPANNLIVYTEDRGKSRVERYSNGKGRFTGVELAILIDEGSASSSEILAGAIQDNDRGVVIGRRSFGKGLVQEQVQFGDGSAVRLTVARYYTPTGRSIQKPYDDGAEEYYSDFVNRWEHREMFTADSIKFADSLRFTTPQGKVVYGGGGIMPDIFVPLDTTAVSKYYMDVTRSHILYRYTLEYADRHRDRINAVKSLGDLEAFLDADSGMLEDFIAYAARQGVRRDRKGIKMSEKLLIAQLRAYIGRHSPMEDTGFYANIYPIDDVIMTALKELGSAE